MYIYIYICIYICIYIYIYVCVCVPPQNSGKYHIAPIDISVGSCVQMFKDLPGCFCLFTTIGENGVLASSKTGTFTKDNMDMVREWAADGFCLQN